MAKPGGAAGWGCGDRNVGEGCTGMENVILLNKISNEGSEEEN